MSTSALIVVMFFLIACYFVINAFFSDGDKEPSMNKKMGKVHMKNPRVKKKKGHEALNALGAFNDPWLKRFDKLYTYYENLLQQASIKLKVGGLFFIKELAVFVSIASFIVLELPPPVLFIMLVFSYLGPDAYVKKLIKEREFQILRTFPEVVDLMGLCLSAGLDFMAALKWLTEGRFLFDNPFIEDLTRLKDEIAFGKSRKQALKDMQDRIKIAEVSSLARTLIIAESMGVSVTESFERFSADVRESRFHRGERQARMSAIIILFPLIFFIMPVVGIIIMGPIILRFSQGGFMGSGMM